MSVKNDKQFKVKARAKSVWLHANCRRTHYRYRYTKWYVFAAHRVTDSFTSRRRVPKNNSVFI